MSRIIQIVIGAQLALSMLVLAGCDGGGDVLPPDSAASDEEGEIALGTQAAAPAITMRFQSGVSPATDWEGVADTTLEEDAPTRPDGAAPILRIDRDAPTHSGKSVNALLRFALNAIPPGSTVTSVALNVHVTNRSGGGDSFVLRAMQRDWDEAQATWRQRGNGDSWEEGGGRGAADRDDSALARFLPTTVGSHTITLNAAGIAAVQRWVDAPELNHGFSVDARTNGDGLFLASSEAENPAQRPSLSVTYVPAVDSGSGLLAEFFVGTHHEEKVLHRIDPTVDFRFGQEGPAPELPVDGWSSRWTGWVQPRHSGRYTFITRTDDGARLWVNGVQLIEDWNNHGTVENSGTIVLEAGRTYALRFDHYDSSRSAVAELLWASDRQAREIIPASRLYPAEIPGPAAPPAPEGLVHPGIQITSSQIDFIRARIAEGAQPWTNELARARNSRYGRTTWTPKPVEVMTCGNGGSTVDIGCLDSREDALAAYTLTLIWALTDDQAAAQAAIRILDAYANTLTEVVFENGNNNTYNGPLQAAWLAELFPKSAELLRHYGNSGWSEASAARFGTMLRTALLPRIQDGWYGSGSNWKSSMGNGVINIAVYTDDEELFELALDQWRDNLTWSIHLASDGPFPVGSPEVTNPDGTWKSGLLQRMWNNQQEFGTARTNGIIAETCRDFGHTEFTLESLAQTAETAWIQGVDLYAEGSNRMIAGNEFLARWLNWKPPAGNGMVQVHDAPSWLCGGSLKLQDLPSWEIVFNHYANRMGRSMPETQATVLRNRSKSSYTNLQLSWSKLTHAGVGHTTPR
jgi:hypothetical protein